jgi:hypothetical protein
MKQAAFISSIVQGEAASGRHGGEIIASVARPQHQGVLEGHVVEAVQHSTQALIRSKILGKLESMSPFLA